MAEEFLCDAEEFVKISGPSEFRAEEEFDM
jgi:hypothetical protein